MVIYGEVAKEFYCECGCREEVVDFLSSFKRSYNYFYPGYNNRAASKYEKSIGKNTIPRR